MSGAIEHATCIMVTITNDGHALMNTWHILDLLVRGWACCRVTGKANMDNVLALAGYGHSRGACS